MNTIQTYRRLLLCLADAVMSYFDEPDGNNTPEVEARLRNQRELGRRLLLALDIRQITDIIKEDTIDRKTILSLIDASRYQIHTVMGAPRDWGYDTPLGDVLSQIYKLEINKR